MKKVTNLLVKMSTKMAVGFTALNVNSTCSACYHQGKLPAAAMKLKIKK